MMNRSAQVFNAGFCRQIHSQARVFMKTQQTKKIVAKFVFNEISLLVIRKGPQQQTVKRFFLIHNKIKEFF